MANARPLDAVQQIGEMRSKLASLPVQTVLLAPGAGPRPAAVGPIGEALEARDGLLKTIGDATARQVETKLTLDEIQSTVAAERARDELEQIQDEREERREERRRRREEQGVGAMFQMFQTMLDRFSSGSNDEVAKLRDDLRKLEEQRSREHYDGLLAEAHAESQSIRDELRMLREAQASGGDPYAKDLEHVEQLIQRSRDIQRLFGVREGYDEASSTGMQSWLVRSRIRREEQQWQDELDERAHRREMERRDREAAEAHQARSEEQWDGFLERLQPIAERLLAGDRGQPAQPATYTPPPPVAPALPPGVEMVACANPRCGMPIPFAIAQGQTVAVCAACGSTMRLEPPDEQPPDNIVGFSGDGDAPDMHPYIPPTGSF